MNIQLKERREEKLSELKVTDTFKIPESSFIFMKMDVDGLTVIPVKPKLPVVDEKLSSSQQEDIKPIKVQIPAGKTPVICLSTGQAQYLNLSEKVQIVDLQCVETLEEEILDK